MHSVVRSGAVVGLLGASVLVGSCGNGGGGVAPPEEATIQTTVMLDGAPAPGVEVRLFGPTGAQVTSAQTGANGTAVFSSLTPGSYEVEVVVPAGAELTSGAARRAVAANTGATATVTFELETPGSPPDVVEVRLTANLEFSPSEVTIQRGQTVRWVNDVAMVHTVTPDGHTEWEEANLSSAGETFEVTFENEGTFPYFCTPHASVGMDGVIVVQ